MSQKDKEELRSMVEGILQKVKRMQASCIEIKLEISLLNK